MSRQDVLALLREQEGAFVSGEEISHRLGLSRAAIWKAVDALRREGYTVEARTGRGYRLLDAPDVLTEPEIRRFLGETVRGRPDPWCVWQRWTPPISGPDSWQRRAQRTALWWWRTARRAGPGPTGPELSVPRRPGDLPDGPAAAGSAAGAAVAGDGHGWSSGVSGL